MELARSADNRHCLVQYNKTEVAALSALKLLLSERPQSMRSSSGDRIDSSMSHSPQREVLELLGARGAVPSQD